MIWARANVRLHITVFGDTLPGKVMLGKQKARTQNQIIYQYKIYYFRLSISKFLGKIIMTEKKSQRNKKLQSPNKKAKIHGAEAVPFNIHAFPIRQATRKVGAISRNYRVSL